LVAFGTLFYAGAAALQIYLMNESSRHTDEQIGRIIANANWQARSMDLSEKQAEKSLDTAIEQSRLDERGWLGVADLKLTLNKTERIKVGITALALGKSPAVGVTTRVALVPFPASHILRQRDIFFDYPKRNSGTMMPSAFFPIYENAANLTAEDEKKLVDAVLQKAAVLYFWGEINYKDVFNGPHWTHFCYAIVSAKAEDSHPCGIYNDSDADYQKQ
jgi:hypothetical protein